MEVMNTVKCKRCGDKKRYTTDEMRKLTKINYNAHDGYYVVNCVLCHKKRDRKKLLWVEVDSVLMASGEYRDYEIWFDTKRLKKLPKITVLLLKKGTCSEIMRKTFTSVQKARRWCERNNGNK